MEIHRVWDLVALFRTILLPVGLGQDEIELSRDFHDRLAQLQQECAVALAAFNQCSSATQRELVTAHGSSSNKLDIMQRFVDLTQKENEAYARYLETRHEVFKHLKRALNKANHKAPVHQAS